MDINVTWVDKRDPICLLLSHVDHFNPAPGIPGVFPQQWNYSELFGMAEAVGIVRMTTCTLEPAAQIEISAHQVVSPYCDIPGIQPPPMSCPTT